MWNTSLHSDFFLFCVFTKEQIWTNPIWGAASDWVRWFNTFALIFLCFCMKLVRCNQERRHLVIHLGLWSNWNSTQRLRAWAHSLSAGMGNIPYHLLLWEASLYHRACSFVSVTRLIQKRRIPSGWTMYVSFQIPSSVGPWQEFEKEISPSGKCWSDGYLK